MAVPDLSGEPHRLGHPLPPKKPNSSQLPLPPIGRWTLTSPRQRRCIVLATLLTVAILWSLLLFRPGAKVRVFPPEPPLPICQPGQASGCVGGQANVLLLPAAAQPSLLPASGAR